MPWQVGEAAGFHAAWAALAHAQLSSLCPRVQGGLQAKVRPPPRCSHRRLSLVSMFCLEGVDPEMRIRFTSPHPKDFSDDVLNASAARGQRF